MDLVAHGCTKPDVGHAVSIPARLQTMALHSLADQITSHELKVEQRHSVSIRAMQLLPKLWENYADPSCSLARTDSVTDDVCGALDMCGRLRHLKGKPPQTITLRLLTDSKNIARTD